MIPTGPETGGDGGDAVAVLRGRANGGPALFPGDEPGKARRKTEVREGFKPRFASTAQRFRDKLREFYGAQRGGGVQYAEVFEISEYGRRPTAEEIRRLFPFFGQQVRTGSIRRRWRCATSLL